MMKKFAFGLILLSIMMHMPACKKETPQRPIPFDTVQLLTAKPWTLVSYGYDANNNSTIESNEDAIRDCEKDNTYFFYTDGSGLMKENALICDGNDSTNVFHWTLQDNNTELGFIYGVAELPVLTADAMVLSDSKLGATKLLFICKH
jgi:hypothetical protein